MSLSVILTACAPGQEGKDRTGEDGTDTQETAGEKTVELGDQVTVEYITALQDGTVIDRSSDYDIPVIFVVGTRQVVPGLEKAVLGMKSGEEKQVILTPEAAYGVRDPELVRMVSREQFPDGPELREGMSLTMELEGGRKVSARLIKLMEDKVILDLNHPLAGETLIFDILVTAIQKE